MAKPAWIEIINGASGSGSTTRTLKAKAHTGRLSRSGSIKGTVSSGESDTVSLSQIGANEFISINLQSYSVTALGGVVTITGTSNSPSLKITNLSNASIISSRSLKINGTTYTWDGDSSHLIANDPGAANTYSFEISLSITENQTESSRSTSFYLSDSGSTVVKTSTISITQAAGVKTYGTEDFTLNYNIWDIPASGGTASCIYSFTIPWGWNGKTSGGGTLTQNDEHTIEFNYRDDGPDYPFDWSLDSNTGDITVASLGTNETTSSSGNIYIQATVTIQGKTIYAEDYVEQQANEVSYRLGDIELSVDDIPASGGTASVNFISGIGYTNYSSGESSTTSLFSSSDVSIDHNDVSADNLGTTVKSRTKVGTLNVIVTWNGVTEFPSLDVYQEANAITSVEYGIPSVSLTVDDIPASGGTISSGTVTYSQTQEQYYTSGASETLSEITSGGTVSYGSAVSASSLGTTKKSRSVVGTLTVDVTLNGKSGSASVDVYQEANAITSVEYGIPSVSLTVDDIPASGGTISSGTVTYSQTQEQYYTSGASETLSEITSGGTVSYGSAVSASSLGTTKKSRSVVGTLTVDVTLNGKSGSASVDVYQEANKIENTTYEGGEITYEDVSIGEITDGYIPASGGTATATAGDGSQSWSRTSETKINHYTSGEREELLHDFARSGTDKISPSVDSIKAVAASRGTTVGSTITLKTQTVTWIGEGGLSKSGVIVIYQEENKVEETSTEGGNVSYSDLVAGDITNGIIPASGGSATATAGKGSVVKAIESTYNVNTYTSGSIDRVLANAGSSETIEVEPSVSLISATASSKGTTISEQTVVKSQDVTWETGNLSVSDNMYIYQEANTKSISELKTNIETLNVPAEGCTYSLQEIINPLQYYVYTSGEKKEITPMWFGYEQGANSNTYNFITIEYNNISFGENDGDARSGVVTITVNTIDEDGIVDYPSIIDVDISFIQEKKLKKPSMVIDHNEFYANGNLTFDNNTTIAILKVTDNDNAGWSIHPFSQGAWLLIDSSSLVISGTGASVISVTVKVNETLEDRNGNISLYSGEDQVDSVSVTQLAISKINL